MKGFFKEFREFALKGNVMDMAIGVIIGAAFQNIIKALTDNIISPLLGLIFQMDFSSVVIHLTPTVDLGIGAFISAIINFFLMALVLFLIVKAINKIQEQAEALEKKDAPAAEEAPAAPTSEELLTQILAELKDRK
ncbi:MAG: large conductance mechanosensitive channel protein MscL [Lachnospiraceae bacterium]|jgi:large conductance mechanosensitive channel|nr:large conductance mechanosensitive channel protein MscL [Lachnospiraceae bacterium]